MTAVVGLFLVLCFTVLVVDAEGNITCSGTGMDWYTSVVGETPCKTYERLRQICNSNYQVGNQNVNTPPDFCDDQRHDCCCNSVSFSLSMLCLNCQQNIGTGDGFDAGAGAYQLYLSNGGTTTMCSPNTNQSLPTDIQTAVCNNNIRIMDGIYKTYWSTGDWFYTYVRESLQTDLNTKANKTFNVCPSPSSSSTTPTAGASSTSHSATSSTPSASSTPSPAPSSGLNRGAIAGIAVGASAFVAALIAIAWVLLRSMRKNRQQLAGSTFDEPYDGSVHGVTPFMTEYPHSHSANSRPGHLRAPSAVELMSSVNDSSANGSSLSMRGGSAPSSHSGYSAAPLPASTTPQTYSEKSRRPTVGQSHSPSNSNSYPHTQQPSLSSPPLSSSAPSEPESQQALSARSDPLPDRHLDAGPYDLYSGLVRHPSGRLPPAYGEQIG